jgi:hypothetical protein
VLQKYAQITKKSNLFLRNFSLHLSLQICILIIAVAIRRRIQALPLATMFTGKWFLATLLMEKFYKIRY